MAAADRARAQAVATLDPSQHLRDVHRRLYTLEDDRAELRRAEGRWEHTPVGYAIRAAQDAQEAARDAYLRATKPGASRWERRRWNREHTHRLDTLADAVAERDRLLEPELAPLDAAIDDIRNEHETAQLEATTRRLTERLRRLEHGVDVSADQVTPTRGRHLGW